MVGIFLTVLIEIAFLENAKNGGQSLKLDHITIKNCNVIILLLK